MLRVNECRLSPELLGLGNHVQRQRSFASRLRPVHLNHTSPGKAPHSQGDVQRETSGGNHTDRHEDVTVA